MRRVAGLIGGLTVLFLLVGTAQGAAEIMLPVIHMDCNGSLPASGFDTENISAVCGVAPPAIGSIQETTTVPDGYTHVPHYYHEQIISQNVLHREANSNSGPCYTPQISHEGEWYKLRTGLSHNWLCAYGDQHMSTYLFDNPVGYIQMKLGLQQTAHVH